MPKHNYDTTTRRGRRRRSIEERLTRLAELHDETFPTDVKYSRFFWRQNDDVEFVPIEPQFLGYVRYFVPYTLDPVLHARVEFLLAYLQVEARDVTRKFSVPSYSVPSHNYGRRPARQELRPVAHAMVSRMAETHPWVWDFFRIETNWNEPPNLWDTRHRTYCVFTRDDLVRLRTRKEYLTHIGIVSTRRRQVQSAQDRWYTNGMYEEYVRKVYGREYYSWDEEDHIQEQKRRHAHFAHELREAEESTGLRCLRPSV